MHGSPGAIPTHLVMISYSPFIALLSRNNFMHVSKNVVSIDGSNFGSSLSLLPEVEASTKLFLASMNVSFGSFVGALQTQALSLGYLPLSSPIVIPLRSMIFTFLSSSRSPDLIICRF